MTQSSEGVRVELIDARRYSPADTRPFESVALLFNLGHAFVVGLARKVERFRVMPGSEEFLIQEEPIVMAMREVTVKAHPADTEYVIKAEATTTNPGEPSQFTFVFVTNSDGSIDERSSRCSADLATT